MAVGFLNLLRHAGISTVLRASEPIAWILTSYPAFVLTIHQRPGYRRWALLPLNILGPLLCFHNVHKLASGLDWLWAFTSLIYIMHVTSSLYLERWTLATTSPGWSLLACYKAWLNPRRHTLYPVPQVTQYARLRFVVWKTAVFLTLWATYLGLELVTILTLHPRSRDFVAERRTYLHVVPDRAMLLRAFYAFHWAYLTFLILTVANAFLAVLFVAILQLDTPEEWPSLWGSPLEAYCLRRFWGVFWHKIGAPSQAEWGRAFARGVLSLRRGSRSEKLFLAFWVFSLSGGTHIAVNWVTRESAPVDDLIGDMRFLMSNFSGGLLEVVASRILSMNKKQGKQVRWDRRIMGVLWVFIFFYCTVPPWQYPYLYADARSHGPEFKLDVQIPRDIT